MNVLVDEAAQAYFDTLHENHTFIPNTRFNTEEWVATIGGAKLQDKLLQNLHSWIGKRKLRRYLYEKDLIAWTVFPLINFEPLRSYMTAQSRAYQL